MKWRKNNRWLHRKLGYLFFGMAIIYGASGIALNHHIARHWTPSHIEKSIQLEGIQPIKKEKVNKSYINQVLETAGEKSNYKSYYFFSESSLMIYLKNGHILVDINSGDTRLVTIRNRPFFREINFLHYNKPKKLWTYFSDLFALSLIVLSVTGIMMARGKYGVTGKNAILVATGILIPLIFLILYI